MPDLFDEIEDRVENALLAVGDDCTNDAQVQVGVDYPPSSEPGEYCHRRSGELQRNFTGSISGGGSVFNFTLDNPTEYFNYLDQGIGIAARPMRRLINDKWLPEFADRVSSAANNRT